MTRNFTELRESIARSRVGQSRWRCGSPLRKKIVEFAKESRQAGASVRKVAQEFGVSESGLSRWLQSGSGRVRPVRVSEERSSRGPLVLVSGPVVGRKNFYGNRSKSGAKTAAILYSLIETAKLNGFRGSGGAFRECQRGRPSDPGILDRIAEPRRCANSARILHVAKVKSLHSGLAGNQAKAIPDR